MKKSYIKEVNKLVETGVKNIKENTVTLNNNKPIFDKDDFNTYVLVFLFHLPQILIFSKNLKTF